MSGKVDRHLTVLVNKFFSPTATHFDKQEALIGFMAHLRFPLDKESRAWTVSLYDAQYKSEYILRFGLEKSVNNGLNVSGFCESVLNTTIGLGAFDLGLISAKDFHTKTLICSEVAEFIISYRVAFPRDKASIKKAHYFFNKFKSKYKGFNHANRWRIFNKNWVSHKNVSFYLLANLEEDDFLNFGVGENPILDVVGDIIAHPNRFEIFLRKALFIYGELVRALDRRATKDFSFPVLPDGFSLMPITELTLTKDERQAMSEYSGTKYD